MRYDVVNGYTKPVLKNKTLMDCLQFLAEQNPNATLADILRVGWQIIPTESQQLLS